MDTKQKSMHFDFPPRVKSMLRALAELDNITATAALKRLISREYMSRRDEIRAYRQDMKDKD